MIVDYAHNAAAVEATGRMISNVWGGSPAAAITLPGDRRNDLIIRTAETIAAWFGRVIVYEDADKRGREPGEMTEIITRAMRRVRPGITCAAADGPQEALRAAVALADGQPVLFLYEKLAMAHAALDAIGARRAPADGQPGPESPVLSAAAAEVSIPSPAGPGIRCSPASTVAASPPSPPIGGAPVQGRPPTAPGPGRAGAAAVARLTPTAIAGSGLTFSAALAVSALAAEGEQLVPSLTAAAERVASSAMLADTVTTVASRLQRADRPSAWHWGHW